jgi:hypothetical protein
MHPPALQKNCDAFMIPMQAAAKIPGNTRGSHGTSTISPRPQAIRISLSRLQLSTAGFADLLGHQYSAVCVRLLGVYVLLAQFRLIVQRA